MNKIFFQKGVITILLSVLILGVVSVITLGISFLMFQQIKLSRQIGHSVVAFYAAEAGIERCLYEVRKNGATSCPAGDLDIDDAYYISQYSSVNQKIYSEGRYMGTSRKIKLTW